LYRLEYLQADGCLKDCGANIYMITLMKYSVNTGSHTDMKPRMKYDKTIHVAKEGRQMALVGGV
jgi:hypothetical protein